MLILNCLICGPIMRIVFVAFDDHLICNFKRVIILYIRIVESFDMNTSSLEELRECLLNRDKNPIAKRTHAAFLLRTNGSVEAASIIAEALQVREDSSLMRHELAYILGQMQFDTVCPILERILDDESEDLIVRHESAEALGSIGSSTSLQLLHKYCKHVSPEIHETCQIAIDLINWKAADNQPSSTVSSSSGGYLSKDPAPPINHATTIISTNTVEHLRSKLMDSSASLFNRYRAMFALRNMNSDSAALALVAGFNDTSALFRHEIAYVLGQMQRMVTVEALSMVLRNKNEHAMVRHEAAEALGAVGGEYAEKVLSEFTTDDVAVVRESCYVALNIMDYWQD